VARVDLAPGQRRTARFTLHADLTSFTGRELYRVVEPGAVELRVGASSTDIRAVLPVELAGSLRQVGADRVLEPGVAVVDG
jgi:beta-glucosidase